MRRFPVALLTAATLVAGASPALAKETVPVDRPLPVDDRYEVRETLPSGLQLYVRRHEVPKGMVALWLHFGTGSVNETETERGLAHFLEHMAFRGSTHFKPGTVTSRFEDLGVRFGRDQNALTSFDQTTYQIALPRTDPYAISEALLFLSDVAHRLALLDPEIDDERGVVLEEARARAGAQMRILEQLLPLVAPGSLVSERLPIGLPEVVEKIDSKAMKAYWSKWYRPETSTLMIVGDIDAATVAAMAKLAFADWRPAGEPPAPQDGGLLSQGPRRAAVLTDPELTQADLTWLRAEPLEPSTTYGDFRDWCVDHLGTWIVGQRLDELRRTGSAPFQEASFRTQPFVSGAQIRTIDVQSPPERWREAAEALLVEWRRVQQHGVLADELARAKKALIASFEQAVEGAGGVPTIGVLAQLNNLVTQGRQPMSEAQRLEVAKELLPGITLDEVTQELRTAYDLEGGVVYLVMPEKAGLAVPKAEEIEALVASAAAMDVPAPTSSADVDRLVAPPAKAGEVVASAVHAGLDVTHVTYANGLQAYYKALPAGGDSYIQLTLHGGICDEDATNRGITALTVDALDSDGLASSAHDASAIAGWRVGKKFRLNLARSGASVVLSVSGAPDGLAAGLELAHLLLTDGVVTPSALDTVRASLLQDLEDARRSTQQQAFTRMRQRIGGDDPRLALPPESTVRAIDAAAASAWWKRLAATAPMDVVVTGPIDLDAAKALVGTWLATLPARPEGAWAAHVKGNTFERQLAPGGENIRVVTITPTAVALEGWVGIDRNDPIELAHAQHGSMILTTRLLKDVRETRGLTYSIQAFPLIDAYRGIELMGAVFTADKDKLEEAAKIAYETAKQLGQEGPTEAEVNAINVQMSLGLANQKQLPTFWLGTLGGARQLPGGLDDVAKGLEAAEKVDVEGLKAFLANLLRDENYLHVLARPSPPDDDVKPEGDK
ncbi:MAG: M16 family metallopeptidase [Planctomycetota bacterium]